jgi:hypothetical protein
MILRAAVVGCLGYQLAPGLHRNAIALSSQAVPAWHNIVAWLAHVNQAKVQMPNLRAMLPVIASWLAVLFKLAKEGAVGLVSWFAVAWYELNSAVVGINDQMTIQLPSIKSLVVVLASHLAASVAVMKQGTLMFVVALSHMDQNKIPIPGLASLPRVLVSCLANWLAASFALMKHGTVMSAAALSRMDHNAIQIPRLASLPRVLASCLANWFAAVRHTTTVFVSALAYMDHNKVQLPNLASVGPFLASCADQCLSSRSFLLLSGLMVYMRLKALKKEEYVEHATIIDSILSEEISIEKIKMMYLPHAKASFVEEATEVAKELALKVAEKGAGDTFQRLSKELGAAVLDLGKAAQAGANKRPSTETAEYLVSARNRAVRAALDLSNFTQTVSSVGSEVLNTSANVRNLDDAWRKDTLKAIRALEDAPGLMQRQLRRKRLAPLKKEIAVLGLSATPADALTLDVVKAEFKARAKVLHKDVNSARDKTAHRNAEEAYRDMIEAYTKVHETLKSQETLNPWKPRTWRKMIPI